MEILGEAEPHLFPETFGDLILLAQGPGHISVIASWAQQQNVPRREENVHGLLQEVDSSLRGTIIDAECWFIRDGFATVQRRPSMAGENFEGKLETILSELEKMTELMKQPSQKHRSNQ
jgi:hypothetical protein